MKAWYMGTWGRPGHYWWTPDREQHYFGRAGDPPGPWGELDRDGLYSSEVEGEAALYHKDGWTLLCFASRTDDSRPGSHAAFLFRAHLDFDAAVAAMREHFPTVVERFGFEVRPARRTEGER